MPEIKTIKYGLEDTHISPDSLDCKACINYDEEEFVLNKYGDNYLRDYRYIYVLLCEEKKYYIGITKQLCTRIRNHFIYKGSEWTNKYQPIAIINIKKFPKKYTLKKMRQIENIFTLHYMKLFGTNNVRGGRWCSRYDLSELQKHDVNKSMRALL